MHELTITMTKTGQKTAIQKLKEKEITILLLLYRFRFLNRVQIQKMLEHKHHERIRTWLNNLVEQGCIKRDYSKEFAGRPAIYSLAPQGRKQLKSNPEVKTKLLDSRVWREQERTEEFKEHCLFVADIYLSLLKSSTKAKADLYFYAKTDLYGKYYIVRPNPDGYFAIESAKEEIRRCYLDCFDEVLPSQMRTRIKRYFEYYDSDVWFDEFPDRPFPEVILVCPNTRIKGHLYYYIQNKIDEYPDLNMYLTTKELVAKKGLARETLERVVTLD